MDAAFGTRDMRELQRLMQLVTLMMRNAQANGQLEGLLDEGQRRELVELLNKVHHMVYPG